jgi:hypothetical protein
MPDAPASLSVTEPFCQQQHPGRIYRKLG